MTNEELAARIQSGERALIPQLWQQVERFVALRARRWPGEYEDLYQSGFLALVAAVESYDQSAGMSFIGWLAMHLKTAFNEATGYKTNRQRLDPIHRAVSLYAPIGDEDMTVMDTIADPDSLLPFEEAEETMWREQLHAELERALETLPEAQQDTLRRRFYQGETLTAIGKDVGVSTEMIRAREAMGLRGLRKRTVANALRQFIEEQTPYYLRVGVDRFFTTGSSAVEEIAMIRERLGAGKR